MYRKAQILVLLAPCFSLISFLIPFLRNEWPQPMLLFLWGGGMLLCALWELKGFLFTVFCSAIATFLYWPDIANAPLWLFFFFSSLLSNLLLLALAIKETRVWILPLQQKIEEAKKKQENTENQLQQEQQTHAQEYKTWEQEMNKVRSIAETSMGRLDEYKRLVDYQGKQVISYMREKEQYVEDILTKERFLEELRREIAQLKQEEKPEVSESREDLSLIITSYENLLTERENQQDALQEEISALKQQNSEKNEVSLQIKDYEHQLEQLKKKMERESIEVEKRLASLKERKEEEISSIQAQLEKQLTERENELKILRGKKEEEVSSIQKQLIEREAELKALRMRIEEEHAAYQKKLKNEKTPENEEEIYHLYQQLRKQFDEKDRQLHLSRKEMFRLENKLLSLEKEREEKKLEISVQEKEFLRKCKEHAAHQAHIEEERDQLEQLVTQLISN